MSDFKTVALFLGVVGSIASIGAVIGYLIYRKPMLKLTGVEK